MQNFSGQSTVGQVVGVDDLMVTAVHRSRALEQRFSMAPEPETPRLSVSFVPEVGQFLSSLQAARQRHRSAVESLGFFFHDAAVALEDFRSRLSSSDAAAGANFHGIESGLGR